MLGAISVLCWYHPARYLPSMSRKASKAAGEVVEPRELEERVEGGGSGKGWRR
jgi:hypothetical protein